MRFCHWFYLLPVIFFCFAVLQISHHPVPTCFLLLGCCGVSTGYVISVISAHLHPPRLVSWQCLPSQTLHTEVLCRCPTILYLAESLSGSFSHLQIWLSVFSFCSRPWLPSAFGTPLASDRYLPALVLVSPVPLPSYLGSLADGSTQWCEPADDVLPENEVGTVLIIPAFQTGGFLRFLIFPDCLLCEAGYSVPVCGRECVGRCSPVLRCQVHLQSHHCFWYLHHPCIGSPYLLSE